jgi:hypothetical protein
MGRSFSLISVLVLAALPAACSFQKADEKVITMDGSVTPVDVHAPPPTDGTSTFESDASKTCVKTTPQTMNLPPDVLIVLDRSGSMNQAVDGVTTCNTANNNCADMGGSKWAQMVTAVDGFLPTAEATVNWGLLFFGSGGQSSCTVGTVADVAPAPMNAGPITTAIGRQMPATSTPTTLAVKNASAYLRGLKDTNPKFILLATDGIPTCGKAMCASGVVTMGSQMQCDDDNAIAAVAQAYTDGIPTFVIGIATAGMDSTLSAMATAGGYPRMGADKTYYPVASSAELTAALDAIKNQVGTCFFGISAIDPKMMKISGVNADGTPLNAGDFTIVGTTGVKLEGQACQDYTDGKIKSIEVQVDCIVG